jgi:hypothetical protein
MIHSMNPRQRDRRRQGDGTWVTIATDFPFGVAVGYAWRDRISRARRVRYLVDRGRRAAELARAAAALARADLRQTFGMSTTHVQGERHAPNRRRRHGRKQGDDRMTPHISVSLGQSDDWKIVQFPFSSVFSRCLRLCCLNGTSSLLTCRLRWRLVTVHPLAAEAACELMQATSSVIVCYAPIHKRDGATCPICLQCGSAREQNMEHPN